MHSEVKCFVFIGFWFILIAFIFEHAKTAAERLLSVYVPPHTYVK